MGDNRALTLLEKLPDRGFAIVGTRQAQPRALAEVRRIVARLRCRNLVILSGLALGIDRVAHEASLDAGLGTIAVLPGPFNRVYPSENRRLLERLLEQGGLAITERLPGEPTFESCFHKRNRLIAGWSRATWVPQAGLPSGALNTANWARKNGKDCYATPCFPDDPSMAGNQDLIERHEAIPLWSAGDLRKSWNDLIDLDISSRRRHRAFDLELFGASQDAIELARLVRKTQITQGAVNAETILEIVLAQGWEPVRLFEALAEAIDREMIIESRGALKACGK